ncbi:hypothetical protein RN001_008910 [Aquatica leii]|uniref:TEP1-F n=1 Tax=Aquatica leii TaxID=1421715 RepID=A0AAN7PAX7_9COLE|nr:hypothetical protein RN001_008910 [Aquatica leii]
MFCWIFVVFAGVFLPNAFGQEYYKVIAPRVIRPNSEYHAAITIQETSTPTTVNVSLLGLANTGKSFEAHDSITVLPYNTKIANLRVGNIEPGNYRILIRGYGGMQFQATTPLTYIHKSYSVFIQTDKAVYKPGHKIMFRVIILNPQLRPSVDVKNEPFLIQISDGNGNIVKEFKNVNAPKGVFTGELQLSKHLVLGDWNIVVTIRGQAYKKSVYVAKYILPKFLIDIQVPKHLTFKENILKAHILSLYKHGKKVKGNATVTVYPTIYSGVIQPIFQTPVRKVVPIEGSATVDFDIANELNLGDEYERTVVVDVTIEESLTGRRQNNSVEVHLHKYDHKMELIKTADYYKPGLKYTAYIKVSKHDGSPLLPDRNVVKVRHGYSQIDEEYSQTSYQLNKDGIIKLDIYTPQNFTNETALRIESEYMDLKERMPPVPAAVSPSKTYLQVNLVNDKSPKVNDLVEVIVNCTEPMKYINYQVMGRGDVLAAHSFQLDNKKEFKFQFTATYAMAPLAHLLVNYIRPDGQVVADALDVEVDGLIQNSMDIQLNTVESQPESDISLTINSQSNSYVGLMAIDQNVGKLRTGYDLTRENIAEELMSYDVADSSPYYVVMKDSNSHFFWKPGVSNARDTFHDSGAIVLTNGLMTRYRPTLEDIYLRPVSYGSSTVKPDRGVGLAFHTITRPPLAGPYAFSRIPKPVWNVPKVYLTNDIADTWLFTNFSLNIEGKTSIGRKLPNTLTTWVITGFSLDQRYGLGILQSPKKLQVSKSFQLNIDLPHSIQREETLAVPIVVYNNLNNEINVELTIHNPEQKFRFSDVAKEENATKKIELYRRKKLNVKQNSGNSVSFMITPIKLGETEIKVSATVSGVGQDTVTKNLLVVAEGETQYYTKSLLLDLRKKSSYKGNITFDLPKNFVSGSENVEVSVIGDLIWPAVINMNNLIRLPVACGEQNLIHFIPNIILLNYLLNNGQLTLTTLEQTVTNLETAYQEQLMYKRPDGSFSAFGKRDTNSSLWITAYVAYAFKQAKPFIYIDEDIITNALKWIEDHQAANGSFSEVGNIIHHDMQINDNSLALTAFTLIALIENQKTNFAYTNAINKGLDYIGRTINEAHGIYTLAICTYVLHLANHPAARGALNLIDVKASTGENIKWWGAPITKNDEKNPWNKLPKSLDIETTSYVLLSMLEENLLDDSIPVLNWLIQQQSNLGGFTSTQDTVVAMIALNKIVSKLSASSNIQIDITHKEGEENIRVNSNNAMIEQKIKLSNNARQINITAQGQGLAIIKVNYRYNTNVTGPWPLFTLDPQVDKNSDQHHIQLSICTAFVSRNLSSQPESNMAVMEVNLPSGFTADIDSLPSLEVSQNVQKVITKNEDTTVVLYFNNLTVYEYCPTVSAFRTHKIATQKPVPVIVYDYYDSSRRARIFYKIKRITLCDICENEECENQCTFADPQTGESNQPGHSSSLKSDLICLVVMLMILFQR